MKVNGTIERKTTAFGTSYFWTIEKKGKYFVTSGGFESAREAKWYAERHALADGHIVKSWKFVE